MQSRYGLGLLLFVSLTACKLQKPGVGDTASSAKQLRVTPDSYTWTLRFAGPMTSAQAKDGCLGQSGYNYRLPHIDELQAERARLYAMVQDQSMVDAWSGSRQSDQPNHPGYAQLLVLNLKTGRIRTELDQPSNGAVALSFCLCARVPPGAHCSDSGKPALGRELPAR